VSPNKPHAETSALKRETDEPGMHYCKFDLHRTEGKNFLMCPRASLDFIVQLMLHARVAQLSLPDFQELLFPFDLNQIKNPHSKVLDLHFTELPIRSAEILVWANWQRNATAGSSDEHADIAPDLFTAETLLGTYQGITEKVLSRTPAAFRTVLVPRGSSKPEWLAR
jgi:hypothetical protein